MPHIVSRKHGSQCRRGCSLPLATLAAGLSLALPVLATDTSPAETPTDADQATTLDKVQVRGLRSFVVSPKFTQTLQDTPQTVQIIGSELFNQQGAATLTEALRNSAGVGTFYAGENGNTTSGDAVSMRGFDTSSSIFVDGARDLGSVSRDLFNIDQVEVVKGPAGTDTGRSAPNGAINLASKQAQLREATGATLSVGSDGQKRATGDWNTPLAHGAALRLNAMWQDSDVPGRDRVNNSRVGLAPSLGFGLDGATRVWMNLLYVKQDNVPDGFVPTIGLPYWQPQPGLEALVGHPVDPSNFYGTRDDHDDVTVRMATLRLEHDAGDTLRISNTLRWGTTKQAYLLTSFMGTGGTAANPMGGNIKWTDPNDLATYTLARSSPTFKDQENTILTNHFNVRADVGNDNLHHFLSAGLELIREEQTGHGIATTGSRPAANLYNPDWRDIGTFAWHRSGAQTHGRTDTQALYLFDTMKIGEHLLVTAGLRADHYTTRYNATAICTTATPVPRGGVACPAGTANGTLIPTVNLRDSDTLLNYKLGVIYKPVESLSLYANAALSQQPPGGGNFALNTSANSADNINNDPQKAKTFEAGAKWAANNALALNLALFQTTVTNEIAADASAPSGYSQTGKKRVRGVEASVIGNITERWNVSLGYLHQDATVEAGSIVAADGTPNLTYTPGNAFTSWTTYRFPFGLTLGGGIRHTGGLHRGTDGAKGTPALTRAWTVVDAVLSHDITEHFSLRLNAYNLFDKAYVASINKSGYRYTPGTPRTFLLSADFRF